MEAKDSSQESILTSPSTQQPPQEESLKQKGYFLPVLIAVVILVGIGAGGYFLYQKQAKPTTTSQSISQPTPSPTSDETANWKTYTNPKYNFTFKYPPDWILKETPAEKIGVPNSYEVAILNPEPEKGPTGAVPSFGVGIDKLDLSTGYKENSTFNGIKAYRFSAPSGMQNAVESIEFKKDDNRYNIFLLYDDGNVQKKPYDPGIYNKEAVGIFNKFLSSFRFTQ